jgi:hypothetical protein
MTLTERIQRLLDLSKTEAFEEGVAWNPVTGDIRCYQGNAGSIDFSAEEQRALRGYWFFHNHPKDTSYSMFAGLSIDDITFARENGLRGVVAFSCGNVISVYVTNYRSRLPYWIDFNAEIQKMPYGFDYRLACYNTRTAAIPGVVHAEIER